MTTPIEELETKLEKANGWQEEYNFPFKTDGELNPEYSKILGLLYENDKLKARVKFLEETYYYDGKKFMITVAELQNKIEELETELTKNK